LDIFQNPFVMSKNLEHISSNNSEETLHYTIRFISCKNISWIFWNGYPLTFIPHTHPLLVVSRYMYICWWFFYLFVYFLYNVVYSQECFLQ